VTGSCTRLKDNGCDLSCAFDFPIRKELLKKLNELLAPDGVVVQSASVRFVELSHMTGQRFEDVYQNKVSSAVEYCGYLPHLASSHPPDQPAPSAVSSSQCLKPCWTFNVAFDVAGRASFTITYKYDSTREAKKCKRCVKCKRPYHTSDRSRHERNCVYLKQDALNQQASDAPRQPAPAPLLAALDQGSSGEITEEQPFCVTGGPPGPSQQKAIISPPFGPLHSPANGQSPQMPFLAPSGPPEGVVRQGAPGYVNNTCEQMPPEAGWEGATAFATAVFSDGDETEDMRLMDLDPPDVNAYDTLIEAYGRCERLDEALRLWRKMTNGREVEPVEPNNYTFKRTLDALADRFHKLVRSGVTPNPVQYMILIKGFAQIKQIDMALWLYRDMKRKGVPCNDVIRPATQHNTYTHTHKRTYLCVHVICAYVGDVQDADRRVQAGV